MKVFLTCLAFLAFVYSDAQKTYTTNNKKVLVYTTADKTDYRITLTDTLHFSPMNQPLEN